MGAIEEAWLEQLQSWWAGELRKLLSLTGLQVKSSKPAKDTKNRSKLSDQVKASIKTREFSKSHQKRMKKKEKQQLNVNLNELDQGLLDVSQGATQEEPVAANSAQDKQQQQRKKLEEAANKTWNKPLTQKQKQKAL